jgi:hypothetical protein
VTLPFLTVPKPGGWGWVPEQPAPSYEVALTCAHVVPNRKNETYDGPTCTEPSLVAVNR